jgi:hypothetical protein
MSAPPEKPSIITARNIYLVAMSAAGLALAFVALAYPNFGEGYATAFTIMLVISFVIDIALMRFVPGEIVPLSIESRFTGFFSGMVIYLLVTALLAG